MSARKMALDALKIMLRRFGNATDKTTPAEMDAIKAIAALEADIAQEVEPTNEEFENLWEMHYGHPADFAADVLERWGGWSSGVLGYGGSLNKKQEPLYTAPQEPAVNAELLDAQRYRHLRDSKTLDQWIWDALDHAEGDVYSKGLDSAVDAAIAKATGSAA